MRNCSEISPFAFRISHCSANAKELESALVSSNDPLSIRRMLAPFEGGIGGDHRGGGGARGVEQRQVCFEIRIAERHAARLPGTRELPHAALVQIQLGDLEAVRRFAERLESRRGLG